MTIEPPNHQQMKTFLIQRPQLVITWPDGTQQTHVLKGDVIRVGRDDKNNDIAIPTEFSSISRKHFEIQREGSSFRVVDLKSLNRVVLNGKLLEGSAILKDGDLIQIGSAEMGQNIRITFQTGAEALLVEMEATAQSKPYLTHGLQASSPESGPYLQVRWPDGRTDFFPLREDVTSLGRSQESDFIFPPSLRFISNDHAVIRRTAEGFNIIDMGSTNGTRVNNRLLTPDAPTPITDGTIIRIGDESFGSSIGLTFYHPLENRLQSMGLSPSVAAPTMVTERVDIHIGREESCDIVLRSPEVSRKHAHVYETNARYWIEDLDSTNGTFVNEQPITSQEIHDGDLIQIGSNVLQFLDGQLTQYHSHGMRVDVIDLSKDVKTRHGPLRILHNIDMSILTREFVAIVGGSGAGKSTLMNALIGFRPSEGQVQLNGHDFYKEYDHFRSQLGYVPQADILHTSLTVEKALDYTGQMRFPASIDANERSQRITEVLETVSMNTETIRKTRISNLSGGQRKRVSIAAELLGDPKLIYLDEATSGLDPGLEKKLMYTLRSMADEGRTVVLITHATANIVQADHVAFLSQGKLVYFGPPQEALSFFDVDDFADIYECIERHGDKWQKIFREEKPAYYQKYVVDRQKTRSLGLKRELPKIRFGIRDIFRQFSMLTQRAIRVLMSDRFTLVLMLLLFPFTATLQLIISTSSILIGDLSILADPVAAAKTLAESYIPFPDLNTFIFVMGLEAVLVGMYVPSNELIKERTVFLRERMVNLKVLPYLFSKVAVFTMFAVIQTFLYLVVLSLKVDFPEQGVYFSAPVELFITLFLTMVAGMGLGFIVSAVSRSSDMAIYILVIFLFFQFFFAGTVFDLRENPAEFLSYLTTTRWALTALGVTIGVEEQVEATVLCNVPPDNPMTPEDESKTTVCFSYPDATEDLMLPYDDDRLLESWGILIAMAVVTLTITGVLVKRLEPA